VFPAFAEAVTRLRAEALQRASAQAGRLVVVLTYDGAFTKKKGLG